MLLKFILLFAVVCAVKSEDADDLKKFQNMIDWKNCMKAGKAVADDQRAIREKYKKPMLEEIKKAIDPVLKEIEKNKECAKSFPHLTKVDWYAEKMFYFCGAMDVEEVKFQEGKNNLFCAQTFLVLPQLVEMSRRNANAIKACKVKEVFEKTFKKVTSNC